MMDVNELLREKQAAIERVRKEIAALQCVIPLLADDGDIPSSIVRPRSVGLTFQSWLSEIPILDCQTQLIRKLKVARDRIN
jgi:hypothetical protein